MEPFALNTRVYYEDTDAGGIVYHANYLKFTERARTEWLRAASFNQHTLLENHLGFVVSKLKAKFKKSAKLDDVLTITCIPIAMRKVAISFYQQVFNQNQDLLFELECQVAFLDLNTHSPTLIPDVAREYAQTQIDAFKEQNFGVNY